MIIQAPDTVAAGGLERVGSDKGADELEVCVEGLKNQGALVTTRLESAKHPYSGEEGGEAELVTGAKVEALGGAE